jgi:glycerol-3-phosphate acyltransferase PlsX
VGANVDSDIKQLTDFAILGEAFARSVLHQSCPKVGLLNIGSEDVKGNEVVKAVDALLRAADLPMDYVGYVEGDDISAGVVDVVVTDGFTGNIALKTAEGTAKLVAQYLRGALTSSWLSKLGALLASGGLKALREKMDPRSANGGVFLGLNGLVVKSHGGTDGLGFASALDLAIDLAGSDFGDQITSALEKVQEKVTAAETALKGDDTATRKETAAQ